jgi:hypothetical protein
MPLVPRRRYQFDAEMMRAFPDVPAGLEDQVRQVLTFEGQGLGNMVDACAEVS